MSKPYQQTMKYHLGATARLSWPISASQFLMFSMVWTDNLMIGRLGVQELAALSLGSVVYSLCFTTGIGLLGGLGPLIAQAYGARQESRIGVYGRHGLLLAFFVSLLSVVVFCLGEPILVFLGQKQSVANLTASYLTFLCAGMPAHLGFVALRQISESTGDGRSPLLAVTLATLANIFLDYVLVFGEWGFPQLGVRGAAIATSLVGWVMFFSLLMRLAWKTHYKQMSLFQELSHFDRGIMSELFRIGFPVAGSLLAEMSLFGGSAIMMGWIGTVALAAHQISINLAALVFMIPLGLSFGTAARVGQAMGAGEKANARRAGYSGFILSMGIQVVFAALFLAFPKSLSMLYTSDVEAIAIAVALLQIAAFFQLFDGLQVVGMGALRGMKDTAIPFYANVFSYWIVGMPVMYVFAFVFDWKAQGIWAGILVALGFASLAHVVRFWYRLRLA